MSGESLKLFEQDSLRADGTLKGMGYFGVLNLPNGGITTEYSEGINLKGVEMEIPMLVPTLTKEELNHTLHHVIPKKEETPKHIFLKALDHAKERLLQNKSPFASEEDTLINIWNKE